MTIETAWDVLSVNLKTHRVAIIKTNQTLRNAEACSEMAVIRRGGDTEFYPVRPAGAYQEGDTFGTKEKP